MILEDIRNLKTGKRELRKFGLVVGGIFAAIGLLLLIRGKAAWPWFATPGLLLVVLGGLIPATLKYIYIGWMAMAFALGFIVSHVILTLFFFLVITPVGLVARLLGKDFLRLRLDRNAPSYWIPRESRDPKAAVHYEQQF
jgi:hypothetical protein